MEENQNLRSVYNSLISYGGSGSYEDFVNYFNASDDNKKSIYNSLVSYGGSGTYDEFLQFVGSSQQPAPRVDVSDVQEAEQGNAPVAETTEIPTVTMEQVEQQPTSTPAPGSDGHFLGNISVGADGEPKPMEENPLRNPDNQPAEERTIPEIEVQKQKVDEVSQALSEATRQRNEQRAQQQRERDEEIGFWGRLAKGLQAAENPITPEVVEVITNPTDNDLRAAQNEVRNAKKQLQLEEMRQNGEMKGLAFIRGIETANYYDLIPVLGTADAMSILSLSQALKEGKELTESQQLLLQAMEARAGVDFNYKDNNTIWERVGQSTPEQLMFTLQFVFGAGLTGATEAGERIAAKEAQKAAIRYAKKGVNSGARRFIGGTVIPKLEGMAVSSTIQTFANPLSLANMAEDFERRYAGDIYYDNDGNLHVFDNDRSAGQAAYQAIASAWIENFTEYSGQNITKSIRLADGKMFDLAGKFDNVMKNVGGGRIKDVFTVPQKLSHLTQIGSAPEEFLEEELGSVMNALFATDAQRGESYGDAFKRTISQSFSGEQQLETLLSVTITSTLLGGGGNAVNAVGNAGYRREVNREVERSKALLGKVHGIDIAELDNKIENGQISDIASYLKEQSDANGWSQDEQGAAVSYVLNRARQIGIKHNDDIAIEEAQQEMRQQAEDMANRWDGNIYNATWKDNEGNEQPVTIINGRIHYTTRENGTIHFNPYTSSGMIAIRLADGTKKQVPSRTITGIQSVMSVDDQLEAQGNTIPQMMQDQFEQEGMAIPTVESVWGGNLVANETQFENGKYTYLGQDQNGLYAFANNDKKTQKDNPIIYMTERQLVEYGLSLNIQAANTTGDTETAQQAQDDLDFMQHLDELTAEATEKDQWDVVKAYASRGFTYEENGMVSVDTDPRIYAAYLLACAEGSFENAMAGIDESVAALVGQQSQQEQAADISTEAGFNAENMANAEQQDGTAAKAIDFYNSVYSVLFQMQAGQQDAVEESVNEMPVSQMEVGQEFPVMYDGQQAVAVVVGKDADGRNVLTIRDQESNDLESGIDDWTDEQWERFKLRPEEVALATQQTEQQESAEIEQNPTEIEQNAPEIEQELHENEQDNEPKLHENEQQEEVSVSPAQQTFDGLVQKYGDKAGHKIDVTAEDKSKTLDKAKKALEKARTDYDDAPIGKEEKAEAALQKAQEEYNTALAEKQEWDEVKAVKDRFVAERLAAQQAADEERHAQAVAEEEARRAEEERKAREREATGANNVAPNIREKWEGASKVEGNADEITLANGERIAGHYVLVESGAASSSHDALHGFAKTEGFPLDENEQSVNDRDYERDQNAQQITRQIAAEYDSRALQQPVVVSQDGVVLSGNGRTMAGEIAAAQNTDGAYIDYLKKYAPKYGFTPEQVEGMAHPRVVFVPDASMPYTAETFAKFNQQEMKGQSKTEQAVKLGKLVDDATFGRIIRSINRFDTLGDFYADTNATADAIGELLKAGAINQMQHTEMFDGDAISAQGREILENMLIGKAFESNPDAVRQLAAYKSLRQSVITALAEISNNIALGEYSLESELSDAIALAYNARKNGYKAGDAVSEFARQGKLFETEEDATAADYTNATVLMLADVMNDNRVTRLKKVLSIYNQQAEQSAAGQTDLFAEGVKTKQEILDEVLVLLQHGTESEQQQALDAAREQRKAAAEQGTGVQENGDTGEGGEGERGAEQPRGADDARQGDLAQAEALNYPLSEETDEFGKPFIKAADGSTTFGEVTEDEGLTPAPIKLSLGENYKDEKGGNHGYGMLHIEAGHGEQIRKAGFATIEEFVEQVAKNYDTVREGGIIAGNQTYLLEISDEHNNTLFIQLSRDGSYWNINSAGIFKEKYSRRKPKVATRPALEPGTTADSSGVNNGETGAEPSPAGNSPTTSDGKDTQNSETESEKQENISETAETPMESAGEGTEQAETEKKKVEEIEFISEIKAKIEFKDKSDEQFFDEIVAALLHDNEKVSAAPLEAMDLLDVEEQMKERIMDYISEHYPTQATVSAMTNSEQGRKEKEAMKNDADLAALRKEVDSQISEADNDIQQKRREIEAILSKPDVSADDVARCWKEAMEYYEKYAPTTGNNKSSQDGTQAEQPIDDSDIDALIEDYKKKAAATNKIWSAWLADPSGKPADYGTTRDEEAKAYGRVREALAGVSEEKLAEMENTNYGDSLLNDLIKEERNRRNEQKEIEQRFVDGLAKQGEIGKPTKPVSIEKILPEFTSRDEQRPIMNCIYYDAEGYAVASDAYILIASKSQYDPKQEGKMVAAHKIKGVAEKGDEVEGKFMKWRNVISQAKANSAEIDLQKLRDFLAGVKGLMKGSKEDATVQVRMPNGAIIGFEPEYLLKFVQGAEAMGVKEIEYIAHNRAITGRSEDGIVLLMPKKISADYGGREFYYDLSDKTDKTDRTKGTEKAEKTDKTETEPKKQPKAPGKAGSLKIDDVGEKIAGARKDMRREIAKGIGEATVQSLIELPFSKAFKKPNLKKAVESGALREEDAFFFDAWLASTVNTTKPKVTQQEVRRKRYNPNAETNLERWAKQTFEALDFLRTFVEADETERDRIIGNLTAEVFPKREAQLAEFERIRELNKGRNDNITFGDCLTPNPVWVTYQVMQRLGYAVGDKLDIPFGILRGNTTGTSYYLYNTKDEHSTYIYPNSLEEGIDAIVWLARIKRGDTDIQHPVSAFYTTPTKSEMGDSGRFRVIWGGWSSMKDQEFDSKEAAEAFAAKKKDAYVNPIQEVKRRFGYKIMFRNPLTGERTAVSDMEFDTKAEAEAYMDGNYDTMNDGANEMLAKESGTKKEVTADDVVGVTVTYGKDGWQYAAVINAAYANNMGMPLVLQEFKTRGEAKAYADSVKDKVFETYRQYKAKQKEFVYFGEGEDTRIGEDYRGGKDVSAEDFMNTFGFRGVQFGNWTNQADRQMAVNQAYDAFMDLAKLIGMSPRAMSLNGELGIAFGARGSGNANAHYEYDEVVINLTKTRGAGSLAHEWWHALDNYFARRGGMSRGMVTDVKSIAMRDELRKAYDRLIDEIEKSNYYKRSVKKGDYWGRMHEVTARLLAEWVNRELKQKGELNTFLARGVDTEKFVKMNYELYKMLMDNAGREAMPFEEYKELDEALSGMPYPSDKEIDAFSDALRNIFETIEEREGENGAVELFSIGDGTDGTNGTDAQQVAYNAVREALANAGIEVVEATEEEVKRLKDSRKQLKDSKGTIRGWVGNDGKIHLTKDGLNAETPIHEYTHLWAEALQMENPELWEQIKGLLKDTPEWKRITSMKEYSNLKDDDRIAGEVLAHISGKKNAERMEAEAKRMIDEAPTLEEAAKAANLLGRMRDALKKFWTWVGKTLLGKKGNINIDQVSNMVLADLVNGVDPFNPNNRRRGRRSLSIEDVNERFNEDIEKYEEGTLPIGYRFELGRPSAYLKSAGFPDLPISMRASLLARKAGDEIHPFDASDLRDLVDAFQQPIAIFKYTRDDMRNLIVDVKHGDKHFLVGVTLNYKSNGIEINSVSGLFPKDSHEWIKWIQDGKAIRIDQKEKVLDLINSLRTNPAESERIGLNLDSAAKIVKEHVNPQVEGENFSDVDLSIDVPDSGRMAVRDEFDEISGAHPTEKAKTIRQKYEQLLTDQVNKFRPLKQLEGILSEKKGRKLRDSESFYSRATMTAARTLPQMEAEREIYLLPLEQAVNEVFGILDPDGKRAGRRTRQEEGGRENETMKQLRQRMADYLIAKHGLERNEWFRQQALAKDPNAQEEDKSGLRGLAESLGENPDDYKAVAERVVAEFEQEVGQQGIDNLWKELNAFTNRLLEMSYNDGFTDKDHYEELKGRWKHYVPLRGFAEGTSDDMYYYTTQGGDSAVTMMKAKGRTSKADDPLTHLVRMQEKAVTAGNDNWAKTALYNAAINLPSDLLRVKQVWYTEDPATGEIVEHYADLTGLASPDDIDAAIKKFNADMKAAGAKRRLNKADVGKRIRPQNIGEHEIEVWVNGKKFVIEVNGNPSLVRAYSESQDELKGFIKGVQKANRLEARLFTTWNPEFAVKNMMRDTNFALFSAFVIGGTKQWNETRKNIHTARLVLPKLMKDGTVSQTLVKDAADRQKLEQWYREFIENGGETGFTRTMNAEQVSRDINDTLRAMAKGNEDGVTKMEKLAGAIEDLNRWAENSTRFAAYITARERGESVTKAMDAAKNSTLNFNIKGYEGKRLRAWFCFFNARLQGVAQLARLAKQNPKRFAIGLGAAVLTGAMVPFLNILLLGLGGDDDDWKTYEYMSEYTGNNNLVLFVPGIHKFVAIPYSQELAPFSAIGNIWFREAMGWNRNKSAWQQELEMGLAYLPMEVNLSDKEGTWPMLGSTVARSVSPTIMQPIVEYAVNENFMNMPLRKDSKYKSELAAWTQAYENRTSGALIKASKWLNGGGSENRWGKAEVLIDPSFIQHVVEGTAGGVGSFIGNARDLFTEPDWFNHLPFVRKFMFDGDPKKWQGGLDRAYSAYAYDFIDERDRRIDAIRYDNQSTLDYARQMWAEHNSTDKAIYDLAKDYRDNLGKYKEKVDGHWVNMSSFGENRYRYKDNGRDLLPIIGLKGMRQYYNDLRANDAEQKLIDEWRGKISEYEMQMVEEIEAVYYRDHIQGKKPVTEGLRKMVDDARGIEE